MVGVPLMRSYACAIRSRRLPLLCVAEPPFLRVAAGVDLGAAVNLTNGDGLCDNYYRFPLGFAPAAVAQHVFLPGVVRVTVVSELTKLGVHGVAKIYERVFALLNNCNVSWLFRQNRRVPAQAVGEIRSLHRGGS